MHGAPASPASIAFSSRCVNNNQLLWLIVSCEQGALHREGGWTGIPAQADMTAPSAWPKPQQNGPKMRWTQIAIDDSLGRERS